MTIVLACTALLVAREVRRNLQAGRALASKHLSIELTPPWRERSAIPSTDASKSEGSWTAWYRDGAFGAYICTHVRVAALDRKRTLSLTCARIEIVQAIAGHRAVLASAAVPLSKEQITPRGGAIRFEVDTSLSAHGPEPRGDCALVLQLNVDGTDVERVLCRIEHRFALSGAELKSTSSQVTPPKLSTR
ncbi:MAG: hypothetical protein ACKVVP_19135 [Chloroflexota bacterium]